jgi:two-component system chemotaxis response regulator CheB
MIRVLLVDDSPVAITIMKRMLSLSTDISIVGTAENGREALDLIPQVKPDVICTDLHMPVMDGLEFTREVMSRHPLPILLVSISAHDGSLNAFKVVEAGAVDILTKPKASSPIDYEKIAPEFIRKIRILSGVRVFRRSRPDLDSGMGTSELKELKPAIRISKSKIQIIVIGASTGGPQALHAILARLPADFPLPVVCIQHIAEGFLGGLVEWLSSQCAAKVRIATPGEPPASGVIYFPREGMHLRIGGDGRFIHSAEPPLDGHRPSITITMESLACYYGSGVLSVLLTGMGRDGATGMRAIAQAGGITVAQDEQSSVVFGMPKQAIELKAAGYVLPLESIVRVISSLANDQTEVRNNGRNAFSK